MKGNFKGVATKYLNNYVVYHNFVNFAKGELNQKMNILREFIYTTESTLRAGKSAIGKEFPC